MIASMDAADHSGLWDAADPDALHDPEVDTSAWDASWGDRMQELVFIGIGMDEEHMRGDSPSSVWKEEGSWLPSNLHFDTHGSECGVLVFTSSFTQHLRVLFSGRLDRCLLTDEELSLGPEGWLLQFEDPLPGWDWEYSETASS